MLRCQIVNPEHALLKFKDFAGMYAGVQIFL
jgi:hypothetical protein